jgi:hypothetical protein
MALTLKVLGIGQLSNTEKTIVPGSPSKGSLVQNISLVNTSASSVTVNVWVKVAWSASTGQAEKRLVSTQNLSIAANSQVVLANDITLGSTTPGYPGSVAPVLDVLTAQASAANVIDYVVCGMERDL